jgi:hypothetical protein
MKEMRILEWRSYVAMMMVSKPPFSLHLNIRKVEQSHYHIEFGMTKEGCLEVNKYV